MTEASGLRRKLISLPVLPITVCIFAASNATAQIVRHEEQVQFGDGEVVTLRMTSEPSEWLIGNQPLATHYEDLAKLAKGGNAVVAENLSDAIKRCETAYDTRANLDSALTLLRDRRLLQVRGEPAAAIRGDVDIEKVAQTVLIEPFEFCSGLTNEQRTSAHEWQALAVSLGNADAAAAALETESDATKRQALFDILWAHGDPEALRAKSQFYEERSKGNDARRDDSVRAYAYMFAMNEFAKYSASVLAPGRLRTTYHNSIASALERLDAALTPEQRRAGVKAAAELMRSNPACCWAL